jgi:DNA-binding beta-propeller fold protein YncE
MRWPTILPVLAALLAAGPACAPAAAFARGAAAPAESTAAVARDSVRADTLAVRLVPVQTLGSGSAGRAVLVEPSGVTTDAFGRVYVTDVSQHRLVRFDARGAWLDETGALGSDPGALRRPTGVVAMGSFGIAVLDRENLRVVLYDLFGRLAGVLTDFATLEDELGRVDPVGLSADRGGALYVAEAERDRVLVLDFAGRYVRALGGFGQGAGSFRGLAGLAAGPHGELVTAERTGARVQRLDASGSVRASWPLPVEPGRGALAVAVDDSARVAVADEATGRVWLFDRAGGLLGLRADLAAPRALAFAPDGSLLVAESAAGRVRRFALEPTRPTAPPGR